MTTSGRYAFISIILKIVLWGFLGRWVKYLYISVTFYRPIHLFISSLSTKTLQNYVSKLTKSTKMTFVDMKSGALHPNLASNFLPEVEIWRTLRMRSGTGILVVLHVDTGNMQLELKS